MNARELGAAYLLGELDETERAAVERRLREDDELRREVEALRPIVSTLETLPAEAWPQPTVAAEPTMEGRSERPRRWTVRPAAALASLLAVAAIGLGLGFLLDGGGGGTDRSEPPLIVLSPLRPTTGEQATVAMPRAGEMVFKAEGLPQLGSGRYYELWLMSDAKKLVPVASFRADADGTALVRVPLPAAPSAYRYFDVSLQRVGSGTDHSAVSVLRGGIS